MSCFCGRSFAGEGLERERFAEHAMTSYQAGMGFAEAKANLESLNRWAGTLNQRMLLGCAGVAQCFIVSSHLLRKRERCQHDILQKCAHSVREAPGKTHQHCSQQECDASFGKCSMQERHDLSLPAL